MGNGVPRDPRKAFEYFRKGAQLGDPISQWRLGEAYATGSGTAKDAKLAAHWTSQAALGGVVGAKVDLAVFYIDGVGIDQSYELAAIWLKEAYQDPLHGEELEIGYRLAMLYLEGKGVPKDELEAFALLHRSARFQHVPAMRARAEMYEQGIGIRRDLGLGKQWREQADEIERFRAGSAGLSETMRDPCSTEYTSRFLRMAIARRKSKPNTLEEYFEGMQFE